MRTATRSAAATASSTANADPKAASKAAAKAASKNINAPKTTRKQRHRSETEWGTPDEGAIAPSSGMQRGQREVLQDWADAS